MKRPGTATPEKRPFSRQRMGAQLRQSRPRSAPPPDREHILTSLPKMSYTQALRSFFIFRGEVYNVALCPSATFRAWITSVTPRQWTEARRAECIDLVDTPEDERLLSRWWTLDALMTCKVPKLTLYRSRQEADARKSEEK